MGEKCWVDWGTWPPAEARFEPIYFREGFGRNSTSFEPITFFNIFILDRVKLALDGILLEIKEDLYYRSLG